MKKFFMLAISSVMMLAQPAVANLATVGQLHRYITEKWHISIEHDISKENHLVAMTYLMQMLDRANEQLNGVKTTDYASNPEYATHGLAAVSATNDAIDNLIKHYEPKFFFTPATSDDTYDFQISAAGTYIIDWGDGNKEGIYKTDVALTKYSHTYTDGKPANEHEIALGGKATKYNTATTNSAISFNLDAGRLSTMRGCLGCVFGTVDNEKLILDARQPRFRRTFMGNTQLTGKIPAELFNGVTGTPVSNMFASTFEGCNSLTGTIPENLFSGISGPPAHSIFSSTFYACAELSGETPPGLFAGISGAPAINMFGGTFGSCTNLSGKIPTELFAGIEPVGNYLTTMFFMTFSTCTGLTGPSAKIGDKYLYEIWPETSGQRTYEHNKGLTDYECIPTGWGGGGTKEPGTCEPDTESTTDN